MIRQCERRSGRIFSSTAALEAQYISKLGCHSESGRCTAFAPGTVGDFASDDCWAKVAFGAVVGGLDVFRGQKRQDTGAVVLRANPVQQSLIIFISEHAVPEMKGEFVPEFVHLFFVVRGVQFALLRR